MIFSSRVFFLSFLTLSFFSLFLFFRFCLVNFITNSVFLLCFLSFLKEERGTERERRRDGERRRPKEERLCEKYGETTKPKGKLFPFFSFRKPDKLFFLMVHNKEKAAAR